MTQKVILFLVWTVIAINATAQNKGKGHELFKEYVNQNETTMKVDGSIIEDKYFDLKIPDGMTESHTDISGWFIHILNFRNDAKIIIIYIPNRNDGNEYKSQALSYRRFKVLCEKENINDGIEKVQYTSKGIFGLNKLAGGGFFAAYLNVKKSDLKAFEYAINSVNLRK